MDDQDAQREEIEVLNSIYTNEFKVINELSCEYSIIITSEENETKSLEIRFILPYDYPSNTCPRFDFKSKYINCDEISYLTSHFERIWNETKGSGSGVLYSWIEFTREYLQEVATETQKIAITKKPISSQIICPQIFHGDPVTERKSTFQAHIATVKDVDEVKKVMSSLMSNRKIANATHNISAYRINGSKEGIFIQDCDDDGENAAGGRLLHLLEILDVRNILVVVTRWYGGILLGPDRFKLINNVARDCLSKEGFIQDDRKKK